MRTKPSRGALRTLLRWVLRDTAGHAELEFIVGASVILMLIFGTIDVGRLLWLYGSLQFAVERAARCASIGSSSCLTASAIQSYALSQVVGQPTLTSSAFAVTYPSCGVQVAATTTFSYFPSSLLPGSVTVKAQSCRPN